MVPLWRKAKDSRILISKRNRDFLFSPPAHKKRQNITVRGGAKGGDKSFSDRTKNRRRSAPLSAPHRSTMTNAMPWSGKTTPWLPFTVMKAASTILPSLSDRNKDTQLSERDYRPLPDKEEPDHTHRPSLIHHTCLFGQWGKSLQYQDEEGYSAVPF